MIATAATIKEVRIADFCQTGSGGTPSRAVAEYFGGTIPWVKSGELRETIITGTEEHLTQAGVENSAAKLLPAHTLLVALYGATVGRIGILGVEATTNQAVCHIIPNKSVADVRYLFYALRSKVDYWLNKRVGGGQPNISQGVIKDTLLPLPPLAEQKRIAGILDAADALCAKRCEALAQLDSLLQATFLDLFGDPVKNPKAWPVKTLDQLGEVLTGGTPSSKLAGMFGGPIPFVTPGDLRETWVEPSRTVTEEGAAEIKTVSRGATFVCCIGATIGKMGKAPTRSAFNQQINAVSWGDGMDANFGLELLRFFKAKIASDGASTTLPILKKSLFQKISIPVPPRDLQNRYSKIVESVERMKALHLQHLAELDTLFASLQSRAFKGEL